jgi:hypothetical protein
MAPAAGSGVATEGISESLIPAIYKPEWPFRNFGEGKARSDDLAGIGRSYRRSRLSRISTSSGAKGEGAESLACKNKISV